MGKFGGEDREVGRSERKYNRMITGYRNTHESYKLRSEVEREEMKYKYKYRK